MINRCPRPELKPYARRWAGILAATVVNQRCAVLADGGYGDLPRSKTVNDPFEVLAYAASLRDAEAHSIIAAFTAHELEAIATAQPTPVMARTTSAMIGVPCCSPLLV